MSVPAEGFGICIATTEDPAGDDYVVARLREAQVRCVRVDYGVDSTGGFRERFVRRLAQEGFKIALHLVPTRKEAEAITTSEGAQKWREFLRANFQRFGRMVEFFEIGTTVNRRRWSGFTVPLYLKAWDIAWEEAQAANVMIAGPNVTDFEPFYNVTLLYAMRKKNRLPAIHTNNLFIERATEPEIYDHKVLRHTLAPLLKLNTVRKSAMLGSIGRWAGVPRTFSMHVSWDLPRIRRRIEEAEEQQADYLTRYCCLTAASGGLDRVYWGPMIGQREGLIDDGTTFFPEVFHVTFYGVANGEVRNFRIRPTFHSFAAVNRFLSGTTFTRRIATTGTLEIYEFESPTHIIHVAWCRNGDCADASKCYPPETLADAEAHDRDGNRLAAVPGVFTQRPVYLHWKKPVDIKMQPSPGAEASVRLSSSATVEYEPIKSAAWRGLMLKGIPQQMILPENFPPMDSSASKVLRNRRNRVWLAAAPWDVNTKIVIKHFHPVRGVRRWMQYFKPNKALRSWNGAHELLRRGLPTPRPITWLEHPKRQRDSESYYVCEAFEGGSSARHAFIAFREGATEFLGVPKKELYKKIGVLVAKLHQRYILFRDLSSGNLLFRPKENGELEFSFIDTGRIFAGTRTAEGLSTRQRLADLIRLCHQLNWREREIFLPMYFAETRIRFKSWMRLAFHYYDWKHRIKKKFRRFRKRN